MTAISEILSIENFAAYMQANVPASERGTVTPAAIVGAPRRTNRSTTAITSMMLTNSVN